MKINNIHEGQIIKNYKELCLLLNEPIKTGNSKKSQLKEFERYFSYTKDKNKFIIKEIYLAPKEKTDKRLESIYGQYIEKLILDLLVQELTENKKKVLNYSTGNLFKTLAMINNNYTYCNTNKPQLAYYLNIDKEYIKDFYNNVYSKLVQTLESALKRLSNKMLIHWYKIFTIAINEPIIEYGELKGYEEIHQRIDSDDDIRFIITTEKKIATEMGYKSKRDIILSEKYKQFNESVTNILQEEWGENIKYYYSSYKILFNDFVTAEQKELELLLENEERKLTQHQLNDTITTNYKLSNKNRYENNLKNNKNLGRPKYKNEQIKISKNFTKINNMLVDYLLDIKSKDIIMQIQRKYSEKERKENILNEEILKAFYTLEEIEDMKK